MTQPQPHEHKVRVVIECSQDERAYIKMQAARKHMTISEYFLAIAKKDIVGDKKSSLSKKETLEAMKELDEGGGHSFESLNDFWEQMGMNLND